VVNGLFPALAAAVNTGDRTKGHGVPLVNACY